MTVAVGFAGLGKMGGVMAPRLVAAGYDVTVWNRSAEKTRPLAALGAAVAPTPRRLAETCPIVFSMMADDAAAEQLFCGDAGFLAGPVAGTLFVEMGTLRPPTVQRLAAAVAACGGGFVESPVLGTQGPAREGRLIALVGGADDDIGRVTPILDHLARRVFHVGAIGKAALMKLSANLMTIGYVELLAEALALGGSGGIALETMLDVLAEGPVATPLLALRRPVFAGASTPPDQVPSTITSVCKDLASIVATAAASGVATPAAAAALASFTAAAAAGWSTHEMADLTNYYRAPKPSVT